MTADLQTFEDLRKAYFKSQQTLFTETSTKSYTGDDFEQAAVCQKTSQAYPKNTVDSWRLYFQQQGLSNVYTRNLSDLWYQWLGSKGFTQASLRDRQRAFYANGTVNL